MQLTIEHDYCRAENTEWNADDESTISINSFVPRR